MPPGVYPGDFSSARAGQARKETLTSRLIDRPIRPLFPKDFRNEVQVIATVLSVDPEINPDIPSLIGASAALAISGLPFDGPIAALRVGYRDGAYIANPGMSALAKSDLDLVVAGTRNAVLMVESEAKMLSEKAMLGAVLFGHEQMQVAIRAIDELVAEVTRASYEWAAPVIDERLVAIGASRGGRAYPRCLCDRGQAGTPRHASRNQAGGG